MESMFYSFQSDRTKNTKVLAFGTSVFGWNIKQILPYQTQRAVEEDCGTFCGQPETVEVQRSFL